MPKPLFAHRPPSPGIPLLCDPLPPRPARRMFAPEGQESSAGLKSVLTESKPKKSGLRA